VGHRDTHYDRCPRKIFRASLLPLIDDIQEWERECARYLVHTPNGICLDKVRSFTRDYSGMHDPRQVVPPSAISSWLQQRVSDGFEHPGLSRDENIDFLLTLQQCLINAPRLRFTESIRSNPVSTGKPYVCLYRGLSIPGNPRDLTFPNCNSWSWSKHTAWSFSISPASVMAGPERKPMILRLRLTEDFHCLNVGRLPFDFTQWGKIVPTRRPAWSQRSSPVSDSERETLLKLLRRDKSTRVPTSLGQPSHFQGTDSEYEVVVQPMTLFDLRRVGEFEGVTVMEPSHVNLWYALRKDGKTTWQLMVPGEIVPGIPFPEEIETKPITSSEREEMTRIADAIERGDPDVTM
jgi:hypothetical protein